MDNLQTARSMNDFRRVLDGYQNRGAHPYFLLQGVRIACFKLEPAEIVRVCAMAEKHVVKHDRILQPVPDPQEEGLGRAVSRLYYDSGEPRPDIPTGIINGAVLETFGDNYIRLLKERRFSYDDDLPVLCSVLQKFLDHPSCDLGVLDNLQHWIGDIYEVFSNDEEVCEEISKATDCIIDGFITRRIKSAGSYRFGRELVENWSRVGAYRFWDLVRSTVDLRHEGVPVTVTDFLLAFMDDLESAETWPKQRAQDVSRFYPAGIKGQSDDDQLFALNAFSSFGSALKDELPQLRTYHAIIRWLRSLTVDIQEKVVLQLAFRYEVSSFVVDERMEAVIEELFGRDTWESLFVDLDTSQWLYKIDEPGYMYIGGVDKTASGYRRFQTTLKRVRQQQHHCHLAEALDNLIQEAGVHLEHAEHAWDYAVNLLSGDVVTVVTHLRQEWMQVRRRDEEFIGKTLGRIDVAQHPQLGDVGAACKFRFSLPSLPNQQIHGELDTEGEMTLRGIIVLTPLARVSIKAAVAQTLVAVLVPSFKDTLPPKLVRGAQLAHTGEIWATRPIIHTLGEIGRDRGVADIESGGTRINPAYADRLFRWLVDEEMTNPHPLFHRRKESAGTSTEPCYRLFKAAKADLLAKRLTLAEVYARTIRSHARPLAIYLDDQGQVCVKKMSARARRNYERHLADGFRKFDFTPVKKIYNHPDGRPVVVEVPRTFNQGTFYTLQDILPFVYDVDLREKVKSLFSGDYPTPEIR